MAEVRMYTTAGCPFCVMAERMLAAKGITDIVRIRVDIDPSARAEMIQRTARRTVPQLYIGDTYVGGYEELAALHHAGKLEELLGV